VARKDKARSVYVTSSDTNIHATAAGDKNGGVAKVPPSAREISSREAPPRPAVSAAHAAVSQPVVSQRYITIVCL